MKRSEMRDTIALTLRGWDDDLITNDDFQKLASVLLQVIQDHGMLPPDKSACGCDYCGGSDFNWDKEDDDLYVGPY